jgi:hypothetical protein
MSGADRMIRGTRPGHAVEFPAVLDGVRAACDEAARHVDAISRAAEAVLAGLPAQATTDARIEVADLRQACRALKQQLGGMLVAAGDPAGLRATGDRWITDVGAPVSSLVAVASDAVLQTDDHWTGAAADAYRATLPAQQAALAAIVTTCQDVDVTLGELASAITAFWIAIGAACLGLVVALAGALGTAATAVGAPAAAGIALAGVGALVVAGDEALSSLTEITASTASRSVALRRRLADSTAFPLGAWPRSTTGLHPGASGWQMR